MDTHKPDGPKGLPIIGNLRQFASTDRIQLLQEWQSTYGDTIHLKLFNRNAYVLTNPADVYQVLVKHPDKVHKSPRLRATLQPMIGESIFLSEDETHRKQRRLTQPAFHMMRIANYADTIVDYGEQLADTWRTKPQTDIHEDMMTVTMGIIARVLFDADVTQDANDLGNAITIGIEGVMHKITHALYLPEWIPTPANRRYAQAIQRVEETITNIINTRRQTMEDNGDLLSMLLLSEDEDGNRMTDKQVRDEAMTMFVAGHETTANALSWTFYLLAQYPDIREKLLAEIDAVLGGRRPTLDDLKNLPYTDMVIKESMRLYPPAWILSRYVLDEIELEKFTAQANDVLLFSPYLTHRDPRWWEKPDEFYPEHFTPEAEKARDRFAYFPFGGGPRVCIGNHFAMMEAKLLLVTLSQHAVVDLAPEANVQPEPSVTLRPKNGIPMTLYHRYLEINMLRNNHDRFGRGAPLPYATRENGVYQFANVSKNSATV